MIIFPKLYFHRFKDIAFTYPALTGKHLYYILIGIRKYFIEIMRLRYNRNSIVKTLVVLFAEGVVEDVEDAEEEKAVACPCEVFVVFFYFIEEHIGRDMKR